ncbi:MAG: pyridoxamine 5'-phosphate oxidase family protein [Clostridia bacterium]|nr:pyridoxamine 5'-phosphate oxidase family protein [Clostridia bacterium]
MFRPIRKKKNALTDEEAKKLLHKERRGVLAVYGKEGYPYAVPVNYFYDEENEKIYFHGAKAGHKVEALKENDKVCFTVLGNEEIREEEWAPFMQSTIIFGRCRLLDDQDEAIKRVAQFAMKYYPSKELVDKEVSEDGRAVQMFEISIEHMSGKQVKEI